MLTDDYAAYARYAAQSEGVIYVQRWVHNRRRFVEAQDSDPQAVDQAVSLIGQLYAVEKRVNKKGLKEDKKRQCRIESSKLLVDEFFGW